MSEIDEVAKILKGNLPEYLQGRENLDAYLGACATILGGAKVKISEFKFHKDYENSEPYMVDMNLNELGFEIPQNVKLSVKRQILRDVMEIHKRRGTEDGIKQSMRFLGLDSVVQKGWAKNADELREGKSAFTGELFTPSDTIYTDLLYGNVIDDADGTKFIGYQHWDSTRLYPSTPLSIVGEAYENGFTTKDSVESTPYVVIDFKDDGIFLVDGAESTDPITGEVFPFTVSERFELLEDIIKFFIKGKYRPTTIRVIAVTTTMSKDDRIVFNEKLTLDYGASAVTDLNLYDEVVGEETFTINYLYTNDQATTIGTSQRMTTDGVYIDPYKVSSMTTNSAVGDVVGLRDHGAYSTVIQIISASTYIPILGIATISYKNTGGATATITYRLNGSVVTTGTVTNGSTISVVNNYRYDAITVTFAAAPTKHTLAITGSAVDWNE